MSITFTFCHGDLVGATLTFDAERVVIGRSASCDVRLPDASVSQRHAFVRRDGTEYAIVDEGSTNGTLVSGVRVQPHTQRLLRTGDRVHIGRAAFDIRIEQAPATRDIPETTRDIALAVVARLLSEAGQSVLPAVVVVEGPDLGTQLRLTEDGREYRIGRGDECDLKLADAEASREHIAVRRKGHAVGVLDLGAHNQTWLGNEALEAGVPALWRRAQALSVGRTVLALIEPLTDALAEIEARADEVIESPVPREPTMGSATPVAAPAPPKVQRVDPQSPSGNRWSVTEIGIAFLGLIVLGASAGGIWWLLRS